MLNIFMRSTCLLQFYIKFELLMQHAMINIANDMNNSNVTVHYMYIIYYINY